MPSLTCRPWESWACGDDPEHLSDLAEQGVQDSGFLTLSLMKNRVLGSSATTSTSDRGATTSACRYDLQKDKECEGNEKCILSEHAANNRARGRRRGGFVATSFLGAYCVIMIFDTSFQHGRAVRMKPTFGRTMIAKKSDVALSHEDSEQAYRDENRRNSKSKSGGSNSRNTPASKTTVSDGSGRGDASRFPIFTVQDVAHAHLNLSKEVALSKNKSTDVKTMSETRNTEGASACVPRVAALYNGNGSAGGDENSMMMYQHQEHQHYDGFSQSMKYYHTPDAVTQSGVSSPYVDNCETAPHILQPQPDENGYNQSSSKDVSSAMRGHPSACKGKKGHGTHLDIISPPATASNEGAKPGTSSTTAFSEKGEESRTTKSSGEASCGASTSFMAGLFGCGHDSAIPFADQHPMPSSPAPYNSWSAPFSPGAVSHSSATWSASGGQASAMDAQAAMNMAAASGAMVYYIPPGAALTWGQTYNWSGGGSGTGTAPAGGGAWTRSKAQPFMEETPVSESIGERRSWGINEPKKDKEDADLQSASCEQGGSSLTKLDPQAAPYLGQQSFLPNAAQHQTSSQGASETSSPQSSANVFYCYYVPPSPAAGGGMISPGSQHAQQAQQLPSILGGGFYGNGMTLPCGGTYTEYPAGCGGNFGNEGSSSEMGKHLHSPQGGSPEKRVAVVKEAQEYVGKAGAPNESEYPAATPGMREADYSQSQARDTSQSHAPQKGICLASAIGRATSSTSGGSGSVAKDPSRPGAIPGPSRVRHVPTLSVAEVVNKMAQQVAARNGKIRSAQAVYNWNPLGRSSSSPASANTAREVVWDTAQKWLSDHTIRKIEVVTGKWTLRGLTWNLLEQMYQTTFVENHSAGSTVTSVVSHLGSDAKGVAKSTASGVTVTGGLFLPFRSGAPPGSTATKGAGTLSGETSNLSSKSGDSMLSESKESSSMQSAAAGGMNSDPARLPSTLPEPVKSNSPWPLPQKLGISYRIEHSHHWKNRKMEQLERLIQTMNPSTRETGEPPLDFALLQECDFLRLQSAHNTWKASAAASQQAMHDQQAGPSKGSATHRHGGKAVGEVAAGTSGGAGTGKPHERQKIRRTQVVDGGQISSEAMKYAMWEVREAWKNTLKKNGLEFLEVGLAQYQDHRKDFLERIDKIQSGLLVDDVQMEKSSTQDLMIVYRTSTLEPLPTGYRDAFSDGNWPDMWHSDRKLEPLEVPSSSSTSRSWHYPLQRRAAGATFRVLQTHPNSGEGESLVELVSLHLRYAAADENAVLIRRRQEENTKRGIATILGGDTNNLLLPGSTGTANVATSLARAAAIIPQEKEQNTRGVAETKMREQAESEPARRSRRSTADDEEEKKAAGASAEADVDRSSATNNNISTVESGSSSATAPATKSRSSGHLIQLDEYMQIYGSGREKLLQEVEQITAPVVGGGEGRGEESEDKAHEEERASSPQKFRCGVVVDAQELEETPSFSEQERRSRSSACEDASSITQIVGSRISSAESCDAVEPSSISDPCGGLKLSRTISPTSATTATRTPRGSSIAGDGKMSSRDSSPAVDFFNGGLTPRPDLCNYRDIEVEAEQGRRQRAAQACAEDVMTEIYDARHSPEQILEVVQQGDIPEEELSWLGMGSSSSSSFPALAKANITLTDASKNSARLSRKSIVKQTTNSSSTCTNPTMMLGDATGNITVAEGTMTMTGDHTIPNDGAGAIEIVMNIEEIHQPEMNIMCAEDQAHAARVREARRPDPEKSYAAALLTSKLGSKTTATVVPMITPTVLRTSKSKSPFAKQAKLSIKGTTQLTSQGGADLTEEEFPALSLSSVAVLTKAASKRAGYEKQATGGARESAGQAQQFLGRAVSTPSGSPTTAETSATATSTMNGTRGGKSCTILRIVPSDLVTQGEDDGSVGDASWQLSSAAQRKLRRKAAKQNRTAANCTSEPGSSPTYVLDVARAETKTMEQRLNTSDSISPPLCDATDFIRGVGAEERKTSGRSAEDTKAQNVEDEREGHACLPQTGTTRIQDAATTTEAAPKILLESQASSRDRNGPTTTCRSITASPAVVAPVKRRMRESAIMALPLEYDVFFVAPASGDSDIGVRNLGGEYWDIDQTSGLLTKKYESPENYMRRSELGKPFENGLPRAMRVQQLAGTQSGSGGRWP
ncbi:unnamed protein product [Amoebophrya sp. A25]|nr:unnamed protein product [Amoebophrya sp. A25]|eukprot:GSA25T00015751001.1